MAFDPVPQTLTLLVCRADAKALRQNHHNFNPTNQLVIRHYTIYFQKSPAFILIFDEALHVDISNYLYFYCHRSLPKPPYTM